MIESRQVVVIVGVVDERRRASPTVSLVPVGVDGARLDSSFFSGSNGRLVTDPSE